MLKMRIFWKNCKNPPASGDAPINTPASGGWELRFQTPVLLLSPAITTLSSSFIALNVFYSLQKEQNKYNKCSDFTSSALVHLFFISNSVVFVDRGHKNISCLRAQGNLATPLYS